jgi:Uncharacterized protein conserved in bacteria (DUF2213)
MKSNRPALNYDLWGNLVVWLPIGKPCTITDPDRQYTVTTGAISDFRSIKTAIGTPIYVWHPEEPITPKNNLPSVGVALSDFRETVEGGVEIQCKITDDLTIKAIVNGELTEVSPGYDVVEGVRVYNHLAIIPTGYAKGGRQMRIQLESSINQNIENSMSLSTEDIKSIVEAMGSYFKSMEDSESAMEAAKCEGYKEGLACSKWIVVGREKGYVGTDVAEAKAHILKESYPSLDTKDMSVETVEGLLIAATLVKESKSEPKPNEEPAKTEIKVPKVTVEGAEKPAATSRYVNYNKIKK